MANLEYAKDGRLLFTKEMKKEYTILMPMMLPVHFTFIRNIFEEYGHKAVLLTSTNANIVNEGLQNVHNDTCYPALLLIGQLIDAVKSGKYDVNKLALIISQTGGGCRASNYIHLLRKALKKNNLEHIPVISFNVNSMEDNPGFKMTMPMVLKLINGVIFGDILMNLANQTRPYEVNKGESDSLVEKWIDKLTHGNHKIYNLKSKHLGDNLIEIAKDFADIKTQGERKIRVGIVGEIYIKYAPLGNNNLEKLLNDEGIETVLLGLLDFVIFMMDHHVADMEILKIKYLKGIASLFSKNILVKKQDILINAIKTQPKFDAPTSFNHIKGLTKGYVSNDNKMGEGWLLTAEMLELISSGVNNIVCTQPFGCLPNHIVGKGMIRKIREQNPNANIVTIDYDPGATKVNQENRIKLMIATARSNEAKQKEKEEKERSDVVSTEKILINV